MGTEKQFVSSNDLSELHSYLVRIRRHIHANPETGPDQPETVKYLVNEFKGMDVHLRHGPDHVGLV